MPSATRGELVGLRAGDRSVVDSPARDGDGRVATETGRIDRESIAGLSSAEIYDLTCEELVGVVRSAQLPFLPSDVQGRLEFQDRHVLERLAFLARQCCRTKGQHDSAEFHAPPELYK